jgi:hypothetical protein
MTQRTRKALREELRRHKTRFWGRNYVITPRLVEWIHGDGLQVIYLMPLNTRPNYYVCQIDSKVSLYNSDESSFADLVLDDLCEKIEEEFGPTEYEWQADNGRTYKRRDPFPAFDDECGTCWGLLAMLTTSKPRVLGRDPE